MASKRASGGPLEEFTSRPRLHVVLPVRDLAAARLFYEDVLGCRVEREQADALVLDFFGCLVTAHRVEEPPPASGPVVRQGEADIPLPSIGLVMGWEDWHRAVDHLDYIGAGYRVAPRVERAEGEEHASFVLADPSGNCLSFTACRPA